jgi:hypothetical protein
MALRSIKHGCVRILQAARIEARLALDVVVDAAEADEV